MPILTRSGRVVIAQSISLRPLHFAWGLGDGAWTSPPAESLDATELTDEVGRRTVTEVGFVVPDVAGEIVLPTGTFTRSLTPTNHLYCRTEFDFADASSAVIREVGLVVGTTLVAGLPPGQNYFTPAQVDNPGRLLHLEHFAPIYRSPSIRPSFEVVITF